MTHVDVSADARRDRDDILDYLEREAGTRIAEKYAVRFRECITRLKSQPRCGSRRVALGPLTRAIHAMPYLMIYDYDPDRDETTL